MRIPLPAVTGGSTPGLDFLNHGSFGACPEAVLERAEPAASRDRTTAGGVLRSPPARPSSTTPGSELAEFVGADPEGLVAWCATPPAGVNTVLAPPSALPQSDELLVTDHAYNACRNALDFVAERSPVPGSSWFGFRSPGITRETGSSNALSTATGPRTRLALIDHVTEPYRPGLSGRDAAQSRSSRSRAIDVLVDGAHAPGMLRSRSTGSGCAYYTGNCHKWICAPKGAGFLYVRSNRRDEIRPLSISHGANTRRPGRSRFHDEFDWTGTDDPTPFLCVPRALEVLESLTPGGWDEVRTTNRRLALAARSLLAEFLDCGLPCPDEMIGSLAALPLPDGEPGSLLTTGPLQAALLEDFRIEVPVMTWPTAPKRLVRVSAQLYNHHDQYERLGRALASLLD